MRGFIAVALIAVGTTGCGYNTIQTNDEAAAAAKQQIEVQLQRRADLVGNLVETVKGQAQQELEVFTQVARARAGLQSAITGGDQDELTGTENRIAVARTDYNEAVQRHNTYIRRFPIVITAKITGAKPREYFEVTDAANREAPKVDFKK